MPRDGGVVSTLDLLGDGLTLFVGPDWDGAPPRRQPPSPPVSVARLDAISARGLGITGPGALLVHPDGQPVALWPGRYDRAEEGCRAVASLGAGRGRGEGLRRLAA